MFFNGERLKEARIFRNMSMTELASKVGIKKQAISQFENNLAKPKPETEFAIVGALGFPRTYFHQKSENIAVNNTFFRALSSASALDKKTQEIKTKLVVQTYNFLCEYLDMPILNLPNLDKFKGDIETQAMSLRAYWDIGEKPIANMVELIEHNGIIVSAFDVDSDKIDAFTQVHNISTYPQYCVVVGNNKKSAVRRNFDIAHELGHIILHSNIENLEELSLEQQKELENEANQFASAFLMPKNAFYNDLIRANELRAYIALKDKWHVSIAAMLIRAKNLERINIKEYQSLMKSMSYRKWRTQEPLDDILQLSAPTLFYSALEVLFENNIMTPQSFMGHLSNYGLAIYPNDLEILLSLPKGTLTPADNNSIVKPIINIKSSYNR